MSNLLSVEYVNASDLTLYERNSRTHSDEQIKQIEASITEFGFTNPILIDEHKQIIAGHGRLLAAKNLNMSTVPTITLKGLTDAQRKAYVIADNKLALNAGWDEELLALEIGELQDMDFDIELIGFDDDELLELMPSEQEEPLTDEDEVPEPPSMPVSVLGDIWQLGNHRLMCGDSTSIDDVERLMGGDDWDVCVFDPPYDIESLYTTAMPVYKEGKKLLVMWDYKRFALAAAKALEAGWSAQYEFIWDGVQSWYTPNRPLQKHKAIGYFSGNPFFNTDKAIIKDGKNRAAKKVRNTRGECDYTPLDGARHLATVESIPNTSQNDSHGHGKPIAWIKAIFAGVGGETYLDLFGGSGASIIACTALKTKCLSMELEPSYCDVIIKRWQDYTGKDAVHIEIGRTYNEMVKERCQD